MDGFENQPLDRDRQEYGAGVSREIHDLAAAETEAPILRMTTSQIIGSCCESERNAMTAHVNTVGEQRHRARDQTADDLGNHPSRIASRSKVYSSISSGSRPPELHIPVVHKGKQLLEVAAFVEDAAGAAVDELVIAVVLAEEERLRDRAEEQVGRCNMALQARLRSGVAAAVSVLYPDNTLPMPRHPRLPSGGPVV